MPRFFIPSIEGSTAEITGKDAFHIGRSLRMRNGDPLTVCCDGIDYSCEIVSISDEAVRLDVLSSCVCKAEPKVKVTLFQALPKLDKLETIVQKSVELGVYRIVPMLTRRCVSRPDFKEFEKKRERLKKISLEAAKQSGRGIIPEVASLVGFDEAIAEAAKADCPLMLYENGGIRFSEAGVENAGTVSLLIGSEGGFDESEAIRADSAGISRIWLGERILHCETAPAAALSIVMYISGNL